MNKIVKRSNYWKWFLQQNDCAKVFENNLSKEQQAEIFRKYVMEVTIETSSACNRKCVYCPLSKIDRKQAFMDNEIWNNVLSQLKQIGFQGKIRLNHIFCVISDS